jgi:hypothetical protein
MWKSLVLASYRVLATMVAISPVVINVILKGDIIMSFLYVPFVSLGFSIIAIYFDRKLVEHLEQVKIKLSHHQTNKSLGSMFSSHIKCCY